MAFKIQAICPECSKAVGVSKRDGAEVIANHSVRSRVTFRRRRHSSRGMYLRVDQGSRVGVQRAFCARAAHAGEVQAGL